MSICLEKTHPVFVNKIANKAIAFLHLPKSREGTATEERILEFVRLVYASTLGCFTSSPVRAMGFFIPAVAELKSRELDRTFLQLKGDYDHFLRNARKYLRNYKGSDALTALKAVPVVSILLDRMDIIRDSIDSLRDPLLLTAEQLAVKSDALPKLLVKPDRLLTDRAHKQFTSRDVTLLNNLGRWYKIHERLKRNVLNDAYDENTERAKSREIYRTPTIGVVMPGFPL